ncbi:dUTPase [Artaxa digramma nucleopolyhedrovirus]|uniref:dUTP diphosphatase n=1 Tax=Artaxa digramma nucleopolyhedrovirus TaxID=3070910 RepID=A0AAE6UZM3_9ABAC|nr:dUTPase [Euproctis digramma nucleopolyhedrovirus]QHB21758.1 dUTPase [Artaxa digramma nucleopolyhedrovirus]
MSSERDYEKKGTLSPLCCKIHLQRNAYMPKLITSKSAGYDLQTPVDFVIKARDSCAIDVGFRMELPLGVYAKIENHSTMTKHQIVVASDVVDNNNYKNNLRVNLFNHGKKSRHFKRGDKIAQIILKKYCIIPVIQVNALGLNCDEEKQEEETYV